MNPFLGRSFSPVAPGTRVLVVTSPLLVRALLRQHFRRTEFLVDVDYRMIGILDAVEANPVHGVLSADVTETTDPSGLGLHPVNVQFDDTVAPFLEADAAVKEAVGEPLHSRPGMPAVPIGLGGDGMLAMFASAMGEKPEAFEAAHPWFRFVGLTPDEQNEVLLQLTDDAFEDAMRQYEEAGPERLREFFDRVPGAVEVLDNPQTPQEQAREVVEQVKTAWRANQTDRPSERFFLVFPDDEGHRLFLRAIFDGRIEALTSARISLEQAHRRYM